MLRQALLFAVVVPLATAFPSLLDCNRDIDVGEAIMSGAAQADTSRSWVIERDGNQVPCGSTYEPGETLIARIDDESGLQYIMELTDGGVFDQSDGGCDAAFLCGRSRCSKGTPDGSGQAVDAPTDGSPLVLHGAWAPGFGNVFIPEDCVLEEAAAPEPSPAPVADPTPAPVAPVPGATPDPTAAPVPGAAPATAAPVPAGQTAAPVLVGDGPTYAPTYAPTTYMPTYAPTASPSYAPTTGPPSLAVQIVGYDEAYVGSGPFVNESFLCWDSTLVNPADGSVIGEATDCLAPIASTTECGLTTTTVGTFKFFDGEEIVVTTNTQGNFLLEPLEVFSGPKDVATSGSGTVLSATPKYSAFSQVRISGLVDFSGFNGTVGDSVGFDCIYIMSK